MSKTTKAVKQIDLDATPTLRSGDPLRAEEDGTAVPLSVFLLEALDDAVVIKDGRPVMPTAKELRARISLALDIEASDGGTLSVSAEQYKMLEGLVAVAYVPAASMRILMAMAPITEIETETEAESEAAQ